MKVKYLIMIVAGLFLFACSENEKTEKELTFLVYMAADNSLSEFATSDINQMELADFDPEKTNVIVQADFLYNAEDPSCRRWQIYPDGLYDEIVSSPVIDQLGEIDSGDWHSLTTFYNWAVAEYPADEYVLSIWSHGNDWYSYPANPNHFCPDFDSSSWFDIPGKDLQQAFQHFKRKPALVIFDACHMQSLEVLSEIISYTSKICGSTDIVPNQGFPYHDVISSLAVESPISNYDILPQIFVDSYRTGGSQNYQGQINQPVNASIINTDVLADTILTNISELVTYSLNNNVDRQKFLTARERCYEFNDLSIDVDLFQFLNFLLENDLETDLYNISSRLAQQIFINRDYYNYPSYFLGNILITFPEEADLDHWINLRDQYYQLDFHILTGWGDFISWLLEADAYCS
ncbi:MAG: hypothetical protein K9N06_12995 [Candidatus Cloacimonetes bacterium]|nr:hypothetical protein [Candidatus Cloacimonadota bacterium]